MLALMDKLDEGTETLPQLIRRVQDAHPELTQTEIARRAGVSIAAVNTWVNGTRVPSQKSCHKLADALGEPHERVFAATQRRAPGPLSPDAEARVLEYFRQLTAEEQRIVERQLAALAADERRA